MAKPAVRRIPPPRTLALDSLDELQAFRRTLSRRWELPQLRVALRIPGLRSARSAELERRMNHWIGRGGGWTALWTAGITTALAACFPIPPAGVESLAALSAWIAQVALGWVGGWVLGKGGMMLTAHLQLARLCRRVEIEAGKR